MVKGNASVPPPPVDPSQNLGSVFYIHAGENPSISLVNPIMNEKNYHSWARSMQRALSTKNKFAFVDGSLLMPENFDPCHVAWERCNNLVHSWLINSVSPSIGESIIYMESAAAAWDDLRDRFSRRDHVRIYELQQEISNFRQGNHLVTEYFTEIKKLWEELDQFRPLLICVCTMRCCCDASRNVRLYRDQDNVMRFLMGLNDAFGAIRSHILASEPFPNLTKTFSLVLQHERQVILNDVHESQVMATVSTDNRRPLGRGRGNQNFRNNGKLCTFCGKTNHPVDYLQILVETPDSRARSSS